MTSRPSTVCVFCGSNVGSDPRYRESAAALGQLLAKRQIDVVYGGGRVGLMGIVADSALQAGGRVFGVIPDRFIPTDHRRLLIDASEPEKLLDAVESCELPAPQKKWLDLSKA